MTPEIQETLVFGEIVADVNRLEVRRNGVLVDLEPKALRVLIYLIANRDRVVGKDELMAEVWAGTFVTDNALTRVIAQIRKQLGDSARSPKYIETSATAGYRFIAEIKAAPLRKAVGGTRRFAAAAGLIVIALAAWRLLAPGGTGGVRLAGLRQVTNSPAADLWPAFSPDASQIAYSSNSSGTFEIYVRSLAPGSTETQVTKDQQENIQPSWSPDGRYLAYVARRRGGIAVVPVSGGAARYVTDRGDTPSWSPDGKFLAFRAASLDLNPAIETTGIPETTIWLVAADGSGARPLTKAGSPAGGHNFPRWSPDGSHVVFSTGGQTNRPWAVEVQTGKLEPIRISAGAVRSPSISPDGMHLFYVGTGGLEPGVWHARLGAGWRAETPEMLVAAGGPTPRDLAISADGRHLAFSQQTGESGIWSVALRADGTASGEALPIIRDRSFRNSEPAFSADGTKLAYSSILQGGEWTVFLANADGSKPMAVTAPDQSSGRPSWRGQYANLGYRVMRKGEWSYWVMSWEGKPAPLELKLDLQRADRMRFSPDGTQLAAHVTTKAGLQLVVEDLATHTIRALTPAEGNFGFPIWSRDGKFVAFSDRSGGRNVMAYVPAEGGPIRRIETGMPQTMGNDWSPDSDRISFAGLSNGVWNIYWVSRTTGRVVQLTRFTSESGFVRYPAWSPKGDRIVFEKNDVSANVYVADLK